MPRVCVFCGSAGPLSSEDAWALWMKDLLPVELGDTWQEMVLRPDGTEQRIGAGSAQVAKVITGRVCQNCNNGWMSTMESTVKPILGPMIQGQPCTLSEFDQAILASWAIKTAAALQYTVPGEAEFMPQHVRDSVRQNQTPPPKHRVYLGALKGDGMLRGGGTKTLNGVVWVSFLLVGRVVFQVVADLREPPGQCPPIARPLFDRIWPSSGTVQWPKHDFPRDLVGLLASSEAVVLGGAVAWRPPTGWDANDELGKFLGIE